MESHYKSALDKIKLSEFQKDRAKHLFYEVDEERRNHMRARSLLKPVAAVAAGLAIVVAANIAIPMLQSQSNPGDVSSHTAISSGFCGGELLYGNSLCKGIDGNGQGVSG